MKHSTECINIPTRELIALGQILGMPIPQSLLDYNANLPPVPPAKGMASILASAITATQKTITLTIPIPGLQAGDIVAVGSERMLVQAVPDNITPGTTTQTIQVMRGVNNTTAAAAAASAALTFATPLSAQMAVRQLIQNALLARSNTANWYAWAYSATPPNFQQAPMQIGGAVFITQSSELAGVVTPPAPGGGTPDPSPPPSGPAQPRSNPSIGRTR